MDYGVVVYSSTTTTNRAKKIAESKIPSLRVFQLPTNIGLKGCNYSLRCEYSALELLRSISTQYDLKIKAVFRESMKDGKKVYDRL